MFLLFVLFFVYFFFSSRRRHTRWPRDWSSDVCSSDLVLLVTAPLLDASGAGGDEQDLAGRMGVPCGAGTGLKRDQAAGRARRVRGGGERVNTDRPREVLSRALRGRLGAGSGDLDRLRVEPGRSYEHDRCGDCVK